ncbi:Phosphate transport system permease protein PstA [bacterium HR17]|uniref:Phosphate transport system permease protein PstA n=1 Tax=Candidatus Fervidibacter japonicus TaxID=2035412 RepID=A0A2H5XCA4_9BACT|nr:Phosphate transport system permease protein PstA [bacterium HR17]
MRRRYWCDRIARIAMVMSVTGLISSLGALIAVVLAKGWQALDWTMLVRLPSGSYYLTGEEGGILNAIVGSSLLAIGATLLALPLALPVALLLQPDYAGRTRVAGALRILLDSLWGVPSIVYGACGFALMVALGWRASLLAGIVTLAGVILPLMVRAMDEVLRAVPKPMKEAAYALGLTRWETMRFVVIRQALPALVTVVLLAFGRAIGDAASVLFTAGYTDNLPRSLFDPVASLPLAVFFLLNSPFPEVQRQAYAAATVLLVSVLVISGSARLLAHRLSRFVVR